MNFVSKRWRQTVLMAFSVITVHARKWDTGRIKNSSCSATSRFILHVTVLGRHFSHSSLGCSHNTCWSLTFHLSKRLVPLRSHCVENEFVFPLFIFLLLCLQNNANKMCRGDLCWLVLYVYVCVQWSLMVQVFFCIMSAVRYIYI